MINFQRINELVKKNVTEKSYMMSFSIDLDNIAPFMCSPFVEDWIWSESTKDLINYIYEVLIPTYLVNSIIAFTDNCNVEDKDYGFTEAVEMYMKENQEMTQNVQVLISMYDVFINKEVSYLEFIKMNIRLEEVLKGLSIDFKTRCYVNPYETRFSSMLKTEKFDYENLSNNF